MKPPGAGFVATKSSLRVNATRTGRRSASAAPTASGSTSPSLPPNEPPSGMGTTRTASSGQPEQPCQVRAHVERALRRRLDDEGAVRLRPRGGRLALEVGLMDPLGLETALDDGVASRQRGRGILVAVPRPGDDVPRAPRRPLVLGRPAGGSVGAAPSRSPPPPPGSAHGALQAPSPPRARRRPAAARSRPRRARPRPRRRPPTRQPRARRAGRRRGSPLGRAARRLASRRARPAAGRPR